MCKPFFVILALGYFHRDMLVQDYLSTSCKFYTKLQDTMYANHKEMAFLITRDF